MDNTNFSCKQTVHTDPENCCQTNNPWRISEKLYTHMGRRVQPTIQRIPGCRQPRYIHSSVSDIRNKKDMIAGLTWSVTSISLTHQEKPGRL